MDHEAWTERQHAWRQIPDDYRTAYEVDLSRILHSRSLRQLEGKTQIITQADGLFHRSRLTHSLEVAQISQGIAQKLRQHRDLPDVLWTYVRDHSLLQAISLVHDLGHPPCGHAGEEALQVSMLKHGGFESNGQTLRILTKLEDFCEQGGANLTRRTLLGTLKYPVPYSSVERGLTKELKLGIGGMPLLQGKHHAPPKCYLDSEEDVVTWLLDPLSDGDRHRVKSQRLTTADCSVMNTADDLAYAFSDLEDAIAIGLITRGGIEEWVPLDLWKPFLERRGITYETMMQRLFTDQSTLKREIGAMHGFGIHHVEFTEQPDMQCELYRYRFELNRDAAQLVAAVKKAVREKMIASPAIQHPRYQMQVMIIRVMDVLMNDPRHHLPEDIYRSYVTAGEDPRVICDWIAMSTEGFLRKIYHRLFTPGYANATDRI